MPFVAILLTVVISLGAMVIDLSNGYSLKTRIKNAIDQSTLAGTSQLAGPATVSNAKNLALQYLTDNLTKTIPSFSSLSLNSTGLSIKAGLYDFTNMTFTWDEVSPNVNSIMVSYTYNSMTFFSNIFMVSSINVGDGATAAKQPAAKALPGSGFPLVIYTTALDGAVNNMITLYSASGMDNSYWTDYTNNNASTTDIKNVVDYFQTGMGTMPPGITVNDTFRVNDGGMGGVFMNLDPNILVGMSYLFSLVTPGANSQVKADGFIGATINSIVDSMGTKSIAITITPGFIDNTFGGLQLNSVMTNVSQNNQSLLADAYGLVQ